MVVNFCHLSMLIIVSGTHLPTLANLTAIVPVCSAGVKVLGCRPEEAKKTIRRKKGTPRVASLIASSFFIFSIEKGQLSLLRPLYSLFHLSSYLSTSFCLFLSAALFCLLISPWVPTSYFFFAPRPGFFSAPSDSSSIPLFLFVYSPARGFIHPYISCLSSLTTSPLAPPASLPRADWQFVLSRPRQLAPVATSQCTAPPPPSSI